MNRFVALLTGFAAAAFVTSGAQAQEQKRDRSRVDSSFFERLDTNNDGTVTLEEIPEERRDRAKQLIERLDEDKDGKLTRKEFEAGVGRARPRGDQPSPRPPARDADTRPDTKRPSEPGRPDEPAQPGEPPRPGRPATPPFGFGGPDLFRALDSDGDGKLSKAELSRAVDALMKHDKDSDGSLTPEEIAAGMRGSLPGPGPRPPGFPGGPGEGPARFVEAMLQRADKDGDGKLSKDEAPEMMRLRFEELDESKDGHLDKEELIKAGARMRERLGDLPGGLGRPPGRPGAEINETNRRAVAAFMREHDKDADGRVSAQEFGEGKEDAFKKLDSNGDGFVSPDEVARNQPPRRPESRDETKKDEPEKQ